MPVAATAAPNAGASKLWAAAISSIRRMTAARFANDLHRRLPKERRAAASSDKRRIARRRGRSLAKERLLCGSRRRLRHARRGRPARCRARARRRCGRAAPALAELDARRADEMHPRPLPSCDSRSPARRLPGIVPQRPAVSRARCDRRASDRAASLTGSRSSPSLITVAINVIEPCSSRAGDFHEATPSERRRSVDSRLARHSRRRRSRSRATLREKRARLSRTSSTCKSAFAQRAGMDDRDVRGDDAFVRRSIAGGADDGRPVVAPFDPALRFAPTFADERDDDGVGGAAGDDRLDQRRLAGSGRAEDVRCERRDRS